MAEIQPTLEDLRDSGVAAWLWDAERARLVWANKSAVAAFDATSLFDLIDRSFDTREQGVARVVELSRTLERGKGETALLQFPSVGLQQAMECRCWLHVLADGRNGLLVTQVPAKPKLSAAPAAIAGNVVAFLPLPVLVLNGQGDILHGNNAAQKLLDGQSYASLGELIASQDRATKLLSRLDGASLVTSTEHARGRDLKCVFSRADVHTISLVLEDVTERRALEQDILAKQILALDAKVAEQRGIDNLPAPQTPAEAFESLGKSIEEAVKSKPIVEAAPPKPSEAVVEKVEPVAPRKVPFVPDAIRMSLERTGKPILIGRNSEGLFATSHAAGLLGHHNVSALFSNTSLWSELFQSSSGAVLSLMTARGEPEAFVSTRATIPWQNGPADQFILQHANVADVSGLKKDNGVTVVEVQPSQPVIVTPVLEKAPPVTTPAKPIIVAETKPPFVAQTQQSTIAYEELKAVLDVASDGIITLDKDGNILSFSAGAESIFGLTQAEVLSKPLGSLLKQDSRKVLRDYLSGFNGPGLASVFNDGREVTGATRDGNAIPLFISVSRLQSPQSRAALCAVVRDITTWKRTERELREAKELAENASRQKSDFLARISHEIRTPLNAIMGFSEVMRTERFGELRNEKYRAYANDIHDSGGHLLALINDLLDLSKVEAGKLELNFTAESVSDATEHATRLLQEEARNARVLIRTSFPPKLPRVVADHRALRQIMLNLLSNAVKYTNPGGQVVVSASLEQDGSMSVRVKDTGVGMTDAQLQDALQPFTRVETPDRQRQGTGLGLPLTKALTEANRARFTMTSAPNQGTTAEIIFPVTRVLAE